MMTDTCGATSSDVTQPPAPRQIFRVPHARPTIPALRRDPCAAWCARYSDLTGARPEARAPDLGSGDAYAERATDGERRDRGVQRRGDAGRAVRRARATGG